MAAGAAVAHLPGNDGYDIELTALGATSASLVVRHPGAGFALPPTDLAAGATLSVRVEPATGRPRRVTLSEHGRPDRFLEVDALDPAGAYDREPPRTTATVAHGTLTVRAGDAGAGVRDTWIVQDGMLERYRGPVDLPAGAAVSVFSTDRAGNAEAAHGPDGAPEPETSVVAALPDRPTVVTVRGEPGRRINATPASGWLRVTTEDTAGGTAVRLEVLRDHAPAARTRDFVRLSYGDGQPTSGLVVVAG